MTDLALRRARSQDVDFLAWVLLASSRGYLACGWFDIALNLAEDRCLQFLRLLCLTQARSLMKSAQSSRVEAGW